MHNTNKKIVLKEKNNRNRGVNGFCTATKTMKTEKDYKRLKASELNSKTRQNDEDYTYEM